MRLRSIKVSNYKSYFQPTQLHLSPGFNIITGRNNAGKTALLEAIALQLIGKPHCSYKTLSSPASYVDPRTVVELTCYFEQIEVTRAVLIPNSEFTLTAPEVSTEFANTIGYRGYQDEPSCLNLAKLFLGEPSHTFAFRFDFAGNTSNTRSIGLPSYGNYKCDAPGGSAKTITYYVAENRALGLLRRDQGGNFTEVGSGRILPHVRDSIYAFRAERFSRGVSSFGSNRMLAANASNLAEVLSILQADPVQFAEFNRLLRAILPDVYGVSVRPVVGSKTDVQIVVWTIPPEKRRPDLTVPLDECGTGIGQVLAMLYVVLASEYAQTIIIDEPQSFLHPGAAEKLIDVLAGFSQHQFVIATHSPMIINACAPETITVIRNVGGVSILEQVGTDSTERLRIYLAEMGATLSDVFGADDVLWVEGVTEEICFPKILTTLTERRLMGTVIRGIRSTGDFEHKHAEAAIDIHNRLSGSTSLLPPAIGFIFDHELRTEQEISELRNRAAVARSGVWLTGRRMYENYLLNPVAIAAVLNVDDIGRDADYSEETVARILTGKLTDKQYFKDVNESNSITAPEMWADAPRLLRDLFRELTGSRVAFDKSEHSVQLTEWLLQRDPERLRQIADLLLEVLEAKSESYKATVA